MGRGNSGRGGGKERVNRRDKTSRLGNNRDGLSDAGRAARDRDPDGNFDFNDHAWSTINRQGCGSCHISDPSQPRRR